jgi:hypothetical protein
MDKVVVLKENQSKEIKLIKSRGGGKFAPPSRL